MIPVPQVGASFAALLADNYLKYVGHPIGTPHSSVADIQFTVREFDRLTQEGVKGNAMSLDLDRFRRSGGKLIMWHGWDHQSIPATGTLDYYQRLWQHNGGLRATQEWARVFMVPALYHCASAARHDPVGRHRPVHHSRTGRALRVTPADTLVRCGAA